LHGLALKVSKNFEDMSKEDLQEYLYNEALPHKTVRRGKEFTVKHTEATLTTYKAHIKRFFLWLEWIRVNQGKTDEEKVTIDKVNVPFKVSWIKTPMMGNKLTFKDLPTEEEVLKIAECMTNQRDRAMVLVTWECAGSPIEILGLRIKDVIFDQYGGQVTFALYKDNKLKTAYRYRTVPIVSSVPDLLLWISMHPNRNDGEAPLWLSNGVDGGKLSYPQFNHIIKKAVKRAGIKKRITLYSFRHMRLTTLGNVLAGHELRKVAGHSKNSAMLTNVYLHEDEETIKNKVYAERGIVMKEEVKQQTPLEPKVCPRCKTRNSPTSKFCMMCSAPLDTRTLFEVEREGELMSRGSESAIVNGEYTELMKAFTKLPPETVKRIQQEMWVKIAVELTKQTS
jgi:integrase/ribosomal protein L40E